MTNRNSIPNLVAGTVIFLATVGAWLYAAERGMETSPLFFIAGPVIGSLFLISPITRAADGAQAAALQTNGQMKSTIKAAVNEALGDRDAARTWQATVGNDSTPPIVAAPVPGERP
jgi:hypothetical protein